MNQDKTNTINNQPIPELSLHKGTPLPRVDREGTIAQFDLADQIGQTVTAPEVEVSKEQVA